MKHNTVRTTRAALCGVLAALLASMVLSACNTMEGAGKDIESAGDAIEDSARDAKN